MAKTETMYEYVVEVTDNPREYGPHVKRYATASDQQTARKQMLEDLATEFPGCELTVIRAAEVGAVLS